MMSTILNDIHSWRARRLMSRSRYRDKLDDLPDDLCAYWARTAATQFEGIPRDALFFARSAEALMAFFDCVAFSGKPCALPSRAADSVWHAWLRHSPLSLQRFCLKHYRRLIPHVEASAMPGPMDEALATCLVAARRIAGVAPGGPHLPDLFATDRRLRMPHGHGYRMVGNRVGVADLDARGRASRPECFPHSLTPAALLSCGLVQAWELPPAPRVGGASCGAAGSVTCADGDSGSCGSSCGGCGGGGGD